MTTTNEIPTTASNPFLEGNYAPVLDEITATDLPVTGTLPPELSGTYLRIGPNPSGPTDPAAYHSFKGEGMVHGVRLRGGRAEWYRNRFVRGEGPGGRTTSPNTNVVAHHGQVLALVEAGQVPVALSPDLETMAAWDCGGELARGYVAHPKIDPETGHLHAVAYSPTTASVRYTVIDGAGRMTRSVSVETQGRPMVHDMALTASSVVLFDLPVVATAQSLARASAPGLGRYDPGAFPYRWDDGYAPRVGLLPREGDAGQVRWYDAPSAYVFHTVNAYDTPEGDVVVDVIRYDRIFAHDIIGAETPPVLARWTLRRGARAVSEQILTERGVEFPRVPPSLVGHQHRYGWFAGFGEAGVLLSDDVTRNRTAGAGAGPLVRFDALTGETTDYDYGDGRVTMEPAFVPRPGAVAEDDGWILSVVYDATADTSELVVVEAGDLSRPPVARVHLPRRVPFGFHGNWVPDDETGAGGATVGASL